MYHSTLLERHSVETSAPPKSFEHARPEDLRLVVLDCPLEGWDDASVGKLFSDLVALKKLGFGASYRDKVLPVDTTDFVGRHYLSCIDGPKGLQVIAGFRSVDFKRCRSFNLPFPALSLACSASAPLHVEAVRRFVERDAAVSYVGSWTIHPGAHSNQRLRALLRDHFVLGSILFHREVGVERFILGATLRFKVDRLLRPAGYRPLDYEGSPLPPLAAQHLHGEPVQLMYLAGASSSVLKRAEYLSDLWNARLVYEGRST
jgi:hypothetical protein